MTQRPDYTNFFEYSYQEALDRYFNSPLLSTDYSCSPKPKKKLDNDRQTVLIDKLLKSKALNKDSAISEETLDKTEIADYLLLYYEGKVCLVSFLNNNYFYVRS